MSAVSAPSCSFALTYPVLVDLHVLGEFSFLPEISPTAQYGDKEAEVEVERVAPKAEEEAAAVAWRRGSEVTKALEVGKAREVPKALEVP